MASFLKMSINAIKTQVQEKRTLLTMSLIKTCIERVQALADISRSRYVVIATKPVHRLQIRPIVHN